MAQIKGERFAALKEKVKAECLRRCYSGSVAGYGGAAYDYTQPAAAGRVIRQEHRDKLSGPLAAINSDGIPQRSGPGPVTEAELAAMETKVAAWAARTMADKSGSDCKTGCTGACYGGCATGCDGCTGGCDGCSGCGSGCSGGCSGCGSGCPTGCSGCGHGCDTGCPDSCDNSCRGTCDGVSGCSGCAGGCSGSCGGYCSSSSK